MSWCLYLSTPSIYINPRKLPEMQGLAVMFFFFLNFTHEALLLNGFFSETWWFVHVLEAKASGWGQAPERLVDCPSDWHFQASHLWQTKNVRCTGRMGPKAVHLHFCLALHWVTLQPGQVIEPLCASVSLSKIFVSPWSPKEGRTHMVYFS